MSPTRSQPKQGGAATPAASEPGTGQKDSGSIGLKSLAGELAALAEVEIQKVLNEDLMGAIRFLWRKLDLYCGSTAVC